MKIDWKRSKWRVAIPIAIILGVIEAAWTRPGAEGPANTWMGMFAILAAFGILTFPKMWRIPLLAIIEEITHLILSVTLMAPTDFTWDFILLRTIFHHWSANFTGVNMYPYIFYPLLTLLGEILYKYFKAKR